MLAEPQDDAKLIRLDAKETGETPKHDRSESQQRKPLPAQVSTGQDRAQLILAAPQQIFEVGRRRTGRLRA
jgi:hypothetical protein